ncbi:MAG: malonate decarboxylase subunit epsilon [Lautropia sp.]|nr:malonate decarboxylase subunit epsilon [Lautropia sp.]
MRVLFSFPGQGAQVPGMLSKLPDVRETRNALAKACVVLGHDPLMHETADALQSTVSVQLCLLIAGVAMARTLMAEGAVPDMVAGMSVGAFPAAVVAGVLDYEAALELVALRARLMEEAFPAGYGMTAVTGLGLSRMEALVDQVNEPESPVFVANVNGEQQIVIAGSDEAMAAVGQLALMNGAARCERLKVSVPSHCELLEPVAVALRRAAATMSFHRPRIDYLSSSAARLLNRPDAICHDLVTNVARRVNWADTIELAWERGARLVVEMPSGSTLTALSQKAFAEGRALASDGCRLDTIGTLVRRSRGSGLGVC